MPLTTCGLTSLTLLNGNVIKTQITFKSTNFEMVNSGQVRVETVVIGRFVRLVYKIPGLYNIFVGKNFASLSLILIQTIL